MTQATINAARLVKAIVARLGDGPPAGPKKEARLRALAKLAKASTDWHVTGIERIQLITVSLEDFVEVAAHWEEQPRV